MTVEYKDARFKLVSLKLKKDDDGNEYAEFEGYGSVFSNEDLGRDVVEPGAFAKTIQENPEIPMLWQHWMDEPIGVHQDLREDGKGLRLRGVINLAVAKGREAYALLKQGAIKGLSIGYDVVQFSIEVNEETGKEIRRLTELKLWEVSLVTFPMNQLARVEVVKARQKDSQVAEVLEEIKSLSEALRVSDSRDTPLVVTYLADWKAVAEAHDRDLKEGRVLSTENRRKLSAVLEAMDGARDPIKQLLDATEPGKTSTPPEVGDPESFQSLLAEFREEAKAIQPQEGAA